MRSPDGVSAHLDRHRPGRLTAELRAAPGATGSPRVSPRPTAADYRRLGELQQRWHTAAAMAGVAAVAVLMFWLLPLPSAGEPHLPRSAAAARP